MFRPGKMTSQVLKSLFKKPATSSYPFVKKPMPKDFRGKLRFYQERCIGCKMCMRDCPSAAITIKPVGEKKFIAEIDLARCLYCAQCVDSCPKEALEATPDFELAQLEHGKLLVVLGEDAGKDSKTETK
jgi:formate hydrogenlyase subunit 6/NADH:ubiquinone oxidoreductase subunit I